MQNTNKPVPVNIKHILRSEAFRKGIYHVQTGHHPIYDEIYGIPREELLLKILIRNRLCPLHIYESGRLFAAEHISLFGSMPPFFKNRKLNYDYVEAYKNHLIREREYVEKYSYL